MTVIDINCDMGESFGAYTIGKDEEVIHFITSSSIACGFHAADPGVMERTVRLCKEKGVMCGAHPGYPDLAGFGRRFMQMSDAEIVNSIVYQTGALKGFLDYHGVSLQHVKLHGALYNLAMSREDLFVLIAREVRKAFGDVVFLALANEKWVKLKHLLKQKGIRVALEAFPDRMYGDDGGLLPRNNAGAVIKDADEIARRAIRMIEQGGIEGVTGRLIRMEIDSLCIHGDNEGAVRAAKRVNEWCSLEGIAILPISRHE